MKKILFCFLFLLVSRFSYSQFYLGWRFTDVLRTISNDQTLSAITQNTSDGLPTLSWYNTKIKAVVIAYFDRNDIESKYTVIYDNITAVSTMMKYFDEKYIRLNSNRWKFYKEDKTIYVEMQRLDNTQFMFIFWYRLS